MSVRDGGGARAGGALGGMGNWSASALWSTLNAAARASVRRGWIRPARLGVRTVGIGNIQAGGAGKTPLVAALANEAHSRGIKALILCRGYGGRRERSGGIIEPKAAGAPEGVVSALEWGDEAALLHDLAPQAVIGVGADRVGSFERARARVTGIGLVILDDAFQHWRIHKDVQIVALTSAGRFGTVFRDWRSALAQADLLVWTKGERRPWTPPGEPRLRIRYVLSPPSEESQAYWLVTGVADGQSVFQSARAAGYRVARHVSFRDHARYDEAQARELFDDAARAGARVALTGKDWVKWRELSLGKERLARIDVLEPEIAWLEGREHWNRVLWQA